MQKHVKLYLDYFGYGEQDFIPCEMCGGKADDIHHIVYKSQGGKDEISNLIGLCRRHHEQAHSGILSKEFIQEIAWERNNKAIDRLIKI